MSMSPDLPFEAEVALMRPLGVRQMGKLVGPPVARLGESPAALPAGVRLLSAVQSYVGGQVALPLRKDGAGSQSSCSRNVVRCTVHTYVAVNRA